MPKWDADQFFVPYYTLGADFARAGRVLLWNPWTNAGSPDFAEPQVGAFSPVVVVLGAMTGGSSAGFRAYWLFVWFMGALGMLLLGRRLQAPAWGATVVSIGFMFSGFFVGHAEHTSFVYVLAWFPFIIWRLDVALATRLSRPACEAGAFWGLSSLAGYPGLVVLNGLFALLWAAGRWLWHGPPYETRPSIGAVGRSMVMLVAVGLVVMSPTYAGFMVEAIEDVPAETSSAASMPRAR